MVAITNAMCGQFKQDLAKAVYSFISNGGAGTSYSMLLLRTDGTGTYDATQIGVGPFQTGSPTTATVGTDEIQTAGAGIAGYTAGGYAWGVTANVTPTYSTAAGANSSSYWTWATNPAWTTATFQASGCIIYKAGGGANSSIAVFSFGPQAVSNGTFTVQLPANANNTSILRIQ